MLQEELVALVDRIRHFGCEFQTVETKSANRITSCWGSKGYNSRSGWTESFLLGPLIGFIIGICLKNMSAGRTETDAQCIKRYNATIGKVVASAFTVAVLILLVS